MKNPEDQIIAYSRGATQQLLSQMRAVPLAQRPAFIMRELSGLDPALPAKVNQTIVTLIGKGYSADDAMARAIEIEAANALLNRFKDTGKRSLSGLGWLGDLGASSVGKDVGNFALNLLGGAACSTALSDLIVDKIGAGSGRDAAAYATAGADALRNAAKCGGSTPAAPAPTPAPAPAPAPAASMPIWPFAVGGVALAGVVVLLLVARKR